MDEIVRFAGWLCLTLFALGILGSCAVPVVLLFDRFRNGRGPRVAGTELPAVPVGMDMNKRYDIAYGSGYGAAPHCEKLLGVRIVGYLNGAREMSTGEYSDSRWLVAELPDGRRAYLRPRSVLWLVEAAQPSAVGIRRADP